MTATPTSDAITPPTADIAKTTPMPVVIRALRVSDIPSIVASKRFSETFLNTVVERVDWSHRKLRVFVAETPDTSELVGFATVGLGYPDYFPKLDDAVVTQMYLADITVVPAFQRRGVGLQLLHFFRQEAEALSVAVFRCECSKEDFLVDFYAKIGLTPVPYKGSHAEYPDSHQMLELWLKPEFATVVNDSKAE
ncbi:hypothetical protein PybrP1_010034 [[Pythium] brassicae (nom. inval.)]|nr:hypothetical protein PybrP1_010034 [[Pythium] brassicae (nom. inval.)]